MMTHFSPLGSSLGFALLALCLPACSAGDQAPGAIGKRIEFTPPSTKDLDDLTFARADGGTVVLARNSELELHGDPNRPFPGRTEQMCTHWLTSCREPTLRTTDDCYASVPLCSS